MEESIGNKGNIDAAIKWFEKALRRTKQPGNIYFYLAEAFEKQNQTEKAQKLYKQWLSIDKNHFKWWVYFATFLAKQRDILKAWKYFKHALKIQPDNQYVRFSLNKLLQKVKNSNKKA